MSDTIVGAFWSLAKARTLACESKRPTGREEKRYGQAWAHADTARARQWCPHSQSCVQARDLHRHMQGNPGGARTHMPMRRGSPPLGGTCLGLRSAQTRTSAQLRKRAQTHTQTHAEVLPR